MPAKHTTRIVWKSREEIRQAKRKAKALNLNFSAFVRLAVEQLPTPK